MKSKTVYLVVNNVISSRVKRGEILHSDDNMKFTNARRGQTIKRYVKAAFTQPKDIRLVFKETIK